jgi:putative addiction module component (TIGR02574 family)
LPTKVRKVFDEALALAVKERAELAAQLLASLDDAEPGVKQAWVAEIARRTADAGAHPDGDEDWRSVLNEIEREVLSR